MTPRTVGSATNHLLPQSDPAPGSTAKVQGTEASRSRSRKRDGSGRLLTWARRSAVVATGAALVAVANPSPLEWTIGLALGVAGEAVRCWSSGYLIKSRELTTGGPYAHVRNPLYLGRLLIVAGVFSAARVPYYANLAFLAVALLVFFVYYMPRKEAVEPERLARLHGDAYVRYRAAVPSLFPRLRAYDRPQGSWRWSSFLGNEEPNMVLALAVYFAVTAVRTGIL